MLKIIFVTIFLSVYISANENKSMKYPSCPIITEQMKRNGFGSFEKPTEGTEIYKKITTFKASRGKNFYYYVQADAREINGEKASSYLEIGIPSPQTASITGIHLDDKCKILQVNTQNFELGADYCQNVDELYNLVKDSPRPVTQTNIDIIEVNKTGKKFKNEFTKDIITFSRITEILKNSKFEKWATNPDSALSLDDVKKTITACEEFVKYLPQRSINRAVIQEDSPAVK